MTDTVTLDILANALVDVAEEMAIVEYRSSFSPIIREMLDFNCGVFDADGRMVSHSEQIPAQLGLMQFALQAVLGKWGADVHEGDALLTNHPYMGGTHTPDLQVFMPCFHRGALVGFTGSIAHHIDIGGRVPGTEAADNTELFHEGLIFPAVKLVERGTRSRTLYDLVAANVRDPHSTVGDLDAQLAACKRGVARIQELCDAEGAAAVRETMQRVIDLSATRAGHAFRDWPRTPVEAEGFLDNEGIAGTSPVRVHARIAIEDPGILVVDVTGSADQVGYGVNVPVSSTHAAAYFVARCFLGGDERHNAGLASRIRVVTRRGSLFDPEPPAAVSARHLTVQRLTDVLVEALGRLLPDRDVAGSQVSFPAFVLQAFDERHGRITLLADIMGGGCGARPGAPGDSAIDPYTSNCALLPAEIAELEYPFVVERSELVDGSGGDGAQPGGLALRRDYRLVAGRADGMYYLEQTVPAFAPAGRHGGARGAPARAWLRRSGAAEVEALPGKGYLYLRRGDVLTLVSAGGGGYGPV